ncbi:MAG: NB-ARC domain-containing protein, partial [Synechocystis sp.]|nr:NB-ARC domain-containing protein [Synechocystis sp.]
METADFIQRFYQLTPKPKAVFIAFLEGTDDEAIAAQLSLSTATVRKHIQNLCDYFEIASIGDLGKQNRRQVLWDLAQGILQQWLVNKNADLRETSVLTPSETASPTPDLTIKGLPQGEQLWGRATERAQLQQWLTDPNVRLGIIAGLPGCGKTCLVSEVVAAAKEQFDWVYWRSLSPPVSFLQWLDEGLTQGGQRPPYLLDSGEHQLDPLLDLLRQKRCLLVFDDWQTLFAPHQFAGHYAVAYQDYQTFLDKIIQIPHQSLILIISHTLPTAISRRLRPGTPVKTLTLDGLGPETPVMLEKLGLSGEAAWPKLLETCGDRPGSLLLANGVIQSLFGGDVESYLAFNPLGITEDHFTLVQQSLSALTPMEQRILTVIALAEGPLSLNHLASQIPLNPLGLLAALNSLTQRHLIRQNDQGLHLEAAIAHGLLSLAVKRIWQELGQLLQNHDLTKPSYWVDYDFH